MANKTLPIVFLNLSGEMIYVIQQRLEAQNISVDKSTRVLQDIINTMLNDQFVEELFKPQDMYSRSALQSVFEKLAHSSIMRLNSTSMAKLYDLMTMVFKYQVVNCLHPEDILLITLNHLDAIKECARSFPDLMTKVEHVYSLLMINYKSMSYGEYESLRCTILLFLQDLHIRVSVLLKLGYQHPNGEFVLQRGIHVPHSFDVPGTIKNVLDNGETVVVSTFGTDEEYDMPLPCGSLEKDGNRGTALGTNIYLSSAAGDSSTSLSLPPIVSDCKNEVKGKDNVPALEELNLLVRLIGRFSEGNKSPEIILSSIDEMEDAFIQEARKENCTIVAIDASKTVKQEELSKISSELFVENETTVKDDILELLDIAEHIGM